MVLSALPEWRGGVVLSDHLAPYRPGKRTRCYTVRGNIPPTGIMVTTGRAASEELLALR